MVTLRPLTSNVPPLLKPTQSSGAEYTLPSHSCSSWIDGQRGRVRLAMGRALPRWSLWPWVTSITSHFVTSSGDFGLLGFANQGSNRTTTPPGVTISTHAWPYHVIVVSPPEVIEQAPPRPSYRVPAQGGPEALRRDWWCQRAPLRA